MWQPTGRVGENRHVMLLGDASCGALREKGTNSDERVNKSPSSYQNGNEPYPQGTWARQRVLSRGQGWGTSGLAATGIRHDVDGGRGYEVDGVVTGRERVG